MGKLLPMVLAVLALAILGGFFARFLLAYYGNSPDAPTGAHGPAADATDWSQAPGTAEEQVCVQFLRLKNAGDPAADKLLGPSPLVPTAPVSKAEADRLQTDFFLRQDVRVVGAGRDKPTGALVLYTKGNVSAPTLDVKTAAGVETAQRTMANPDLVVEVRDGRIHGVAARMHF